MKVANILIAALIIVAYMVLTAFYIIQSKRIEEIKDNYEKLRKDMRDDIYTLKEKMNKIIPDDPKKRTREEIRKIKTIAKVVSQTNLPYDGWRHAILREDEAELIAEKIYDTLAPSVLEKPKR